MKTGLASVESIPGKYHMKINGRVREINSSVEQLLRKVDYSTEKGYCQPISGSRDYHGKGAMYESDCFGICNGDSNCTAFHWNQGARSCEIYTGKNGVKGSGDNHEQCQIKSRSSYSHEVVKLTCGEAAALPYGSPITGAARLVRVKDKPDWQGP